MQFDAPLGTLFGHDGNDPLDIVIVTAAGDMGKLKLNIGDYQFLILVDKIMNSSSVIADCTLNYRETIYIRNVSALKRWIYTHEKTANYEAYSVLSIKPVIVQTEITVKVGI